MKNLLFLLSFILIFSCDNKGKQVGEYVSYGKEINQSGVITQNEMMDKYSTMQVGDTVDIKFKSNITQVCQMEGCWVKLALDKDTETMVEFNDHAFSIPKDSDGKEAIVAGKAFIKNVSVDEQKHYAQDKGATQEQLAAIIQPKKEYYFNAEGILVK